jgi:hypothetical protein
MAIWEAQRLCEALKRHSVGAEVIVEDEPAGMAPTTLDRSNDTSHRAAHS